MRKENQEVGSLPSAEEVQALTQAVQAIRISAVNKQYIALAQKELDQENQADYDRKDFLYKIFLWQDQNDSTRKSCLISVNPNNIADSNTISQLHPLCKTFFYLAFSEMLALTDKQLEEMAKFATARYLNASDTEDYTGYPEKLIKTRELCKRVIMVPGVITKHNLLVEAIKARLEAANIILKSQIEQYLNETPANVAEAQACFRCVLKFHFGGQIEKQTEDLLKQLYTTNEIAHFKSIVQQYLANDKGYRTSDIKDSVVTDYINRTWPFLNITKTNEASQRTAQNSEMIADTDHRQATEESTVIPGNDNRSKTTEEKSGIYR